MARTSTNQRINRRLLPLYIAAFFQSFVLWYNIEKLFMRSIGFNNSVIGIMVAVYSLVMLVVETPSGILADRWSRKGVLILASICIALSSLLGGLSHGIPLYILCAVLWGIFFACYSGMYESIVYDTLVEEAPKKPLYELYYGRIQLLDSTSLVLSSLAGGVLAATTSLRMTYFVTIPIMLIPVWALLRFNEPTLHRQHAIIPLWQQIGDTFRAVTRSRAILPVVCVLILESTLAYCIYEFAQLWLLALHTPVRYFGLANAILLSSLGIGGWAAK